MDQRIERSQRNSAGIAACVDNDEAGGPLVKVEGKLERDRASERLSGDHRLRYPHGRHEVTDELGVAPVRVRKRGGLVGVAGAGEVECPDLVRAAQGVDVESPGACVATAGR